MSLHNLAADKTVICNIPCLLNYETYVRTGVHGDGSCFLHAFLRATKPSYKYKSYNERVERVKELRAQIADLVDDQSLKAIGNGEPRRMLFFQHLGTLVKDGFPGDAPPGVILNQLMNLSLVLEETTTFASNFYAVFLDKIKERCCVTIPEATYEAKFEKFVRGWCYEQFLRANRDMLAEYKRVLLEEQIGSLEVEFIARAVHVNFLFLREKKGRIEPYRTGAEIINPEWPCLVILWINDSHYELVGRLEEDRTVARTFTSDDEIIRKLLDDQR